MYGYRARIGYVAAVAAAEVFPIDFYKLVPNGVSLLLATRPPSGDTRADAAASAAVARDLAAGGADLVLLGGLPLNLSQGLAAHEAALHALETETGVQVSSSATAMRKALRALGARKIGLVHPLKPETDARHAAYVTETGGATPAAVRAGGWMPAELGKIPVEAAVEWGRALKTAQSDIDTLLFLGAHWRTVDAIEPLERELGLSVVTALQACVWEALRRTGVNDPIDGYGRLLREF